LFKTFLFFLLSSQLFATINISESLNLNSFPIEYYIDKSGSIEIDNIKDKNFTQCNSQVSLGGEAKSSWYRYKLSNQSNNAKSLYMHYENGYNITGKVCIYDIRRGAIYNEMCMYANDDIDNPRKYNKYFYGKDLVFEITLQANEEATIYMLNRSLDLQFVEIGLYDNENSKKELANHMSILYIVFIGLFALAIYHIFLFALTQYKEYIYYSFYLLSGTIWGGFQIGLAAEIIGPMTLHELNLSVNLVGVFSLLFAKALFKTHENYPKIDWILSSLAMLFAAITLYGIWDFSGANTLTLYAFPLYFPLFTAVLAYLAYKNTPYARLFFVGDLIFILGGIITELTIVGAIEYHTLGRSMFALTMGIEAMVFAIILSQRIRDLQYAEQAKAQMLIEQNRLASMGDMIQNIAHQWRQPLSKINSYVMTIDAISKQKEIDSALDQIEDTTHYMSQTIDSFRDFFNPNKISTEFHISQVLKDTLKVSLVTMSNKVQVTIEEEHDLIIFGNMNEFQQVLLVIINNAYDAIAGEGKITVLINSNSISICDNGGGITEVEKLFSKHYTTKKSGTGIGLYMAKMIVEESFKGKILVHNTSVGACFKISGLSQSHLEK